MKPENKKPELPAQKDELPDALLDKVAGGSEPTAQGGDATDANLRPKEEPR